MFNRFLIALILGVSLIWVCAAMAVPTQAGLTVFGKPKYPADFKQFDFVSKKAKKGGDIYLAVPGSFDTLNPFIISGVPAAGAAYTFATLLKPSLDELSVAYPYLAECYEISNDKQSITFYVRAGAKFHDGTSINPEDVIFSFETLTTKGSPVYRTLFSDVTKVEKSGETRCKIYIQDIQKPRTSNFDCDAFAYNIKGVLYEE
jgi:microcin C transport system substrate-binding protein